jgi:S-adenosylmethionine-diacylglycerol 3-amino-3-carboxypropyl transferase
LIRESQLANALVRDAALQAGPTSKRGILERVFARMFEGLVYAQIWEDPEVDMAALELGPTSRLVTIASGGCNVMSYLTADPMEIRAVDLNPAHVALLRLKLAAARHLPHYEAFRSFFAEADAPDNLRLYRQFVAPHLAPEVRAYWEGRDLAGRRRITMFRRNLYGHGLLGRTIQLGHVVCRLHGKRPERLLDARDQAEQRRLFEDELAPVFDSRFVRALADLPAAYFGLGIPPAQFDALKADAGGSLAALLRTRVERLACDFPIHQNWFAWQAFGRRYPGQAPGLPPYLRPENFDRLRERVDRAAIEQITFTDYLRRQDARTVDAYVLLDAQDWMSRAQIAALWAEINRTARAGARVIFRTAGEDSPLPQMLPPELLAPWRYEEDRSRDLHARDRSAIYGGFHLYRHQG